MGAYVFTELVNDPPATTLSAALGASAAAPLTDNDKGKAVKLVVGSDASAYELCAAGDEIEGFVQSIAPNTVNGGWAFGGVQIDRRATATVDAGQVGAIAIGGLVVAGTQAAAGTAGGAVVQSGTPVTHKWRVIRHITGTGVAGDTVLLERV